MKILDGRVAAAAVKQSVAAEAVALKSKGVVPHLAAILIGHDGAAETYVASKIKSCAEVGFISSLLRFEEDLPEEKLVEAIGKLNADPAVHGILVQLPLPKQIDPNRIISMIDPRKDVDGFHPENIGKMVLGEPTFISATPLGILLLLKHYGIETAGKNAVVIGRSNIVGRPMSILLSRNDRFGNCTVTLCHSKTKNLEEIASRADIIVAALGSPGFLKGSMVKDGAVVIDVGITRVNDASKKSGYALKGDVDFENVAPKCSFITPVPGGVGLMTIAALLQNTLRAAGAEIL